MYIMWLVWAFWRGGGSILPGGADRIRMASRHVASRHPRHQKPILAHRRPPPDRTRKDEPVPEVGARGIPRDLVSPLGRGSGAPDLAIAAERGAAIIGCDQPRHSRGAPHPPSFVPLEVPGRFGERRGGVDHGSRPARRLPSATGSTPPAARTPRGARAARPGCAW